MSEILLWKNMLPTFVSKIFVVIPFYPEILSIVVYNLPCIP